MATITLEYDAKNAFAVSMIASLKKSGAFKETTILPTQPNQRKRAAHPKAHMCEAKQAIQDVKAGKLNSYSSPQELYNKLGI